MPRKKKKTYSLWPKPTTLQFIQILGVCIHCFFQLQTPHLFQVAMERGILHGWNKVWIKTNFLSINLSKFGTNFLYILPGSLQIMTQLPSFLPSLLPSSLFLSLFLLSSSAPNILTGHLSERDLCWRWGCSPRWLSESSQGLGTSRETLEGGHGQMGTTGQHHKEGGKDGQVAHAGGGPLPWLCSHTEPRQPPAPEGLHFCCSPKGRGISHPFLHPSSFVLHPGWSWVHRDR